MELKRGYKQTEVGVIPEDWQVAPLGNHVRITSGESPFLFKFQSDGIPYFKVDQLNSDGKLLTATPYFFASGRTVPRGSVVFPKRGASIMLNKVRILANDSFMDTNLMALTPADTIRNDYLYYGLLHIGLWRVADTTSIPQINNKHIRPLPFVLPPLSEQRAIAGVLGDVDALIGALDRLIAKKRDLKQAAMQQLLTGQTRLPGFVSRGGSKMSEVGEIPMDWNVRSLEDIARLERGKFSARPRNDPKYFGGEYPFIQTGDIANSNGTVTSFAQTLNRDGLRVSRLFPPSTLFFTIAANIGDVAIAPFATACPDSLVAVMPNNLCVQMWLFYALGSLKKVFEGLATQNAQLNINLEKLRPYLLALPSVPEQAAIASVLSDMDSELSALEERAHKTHHLKQAMMQELLTGRIRLS